MTSESAAGAMMHELDKPTAVSIHDTKLVRIVVIVGLTGMHKTGCSGEKRLVPHVPSSS